jgi:hypothetical protein
MTDYSTIHYSIREKVPLHELISEQEEIESTYLSLRFAQKIRQTSLSCFKQCGGKV